MGMITDNPRFGKALLCRLYQLPDPMVNIADWYRQRHYDLAELSLPELQREFRLVQRRLDYDDDRVAAAWLSDRLDRVMAEIDRRRDAMCAPRPLNREPTGGGFVPAPIRGGGRRHG